MKGSAMLCFDDALVYEKNMSDYETSRDILTGSRYLKLTWIQSFVVHYKPICPVASLDFTYTRICRLLSLVYDF